MISAILIDDEQEGLGVLEHELKRLDVDIEISGKYSNPESALDVLKNNPPYDIVPG
jgi:hypothetical protein